MQHLQTAALVALALASVWALVQVGVSFWVDRPGGREQGQVLADLLEAAEPIVVELEKALPTGPVRASEARARLEKILADKGITGDAKRVYQRHIPWLIEVALARRFPKS